MGRTFAIGDIHGELDHLLQLMTTFPPLAADDTLVFIGDYLDRGPHPELVVRFLRRDLPQTVPARVVLLRGNHEDAWLRVRRQGWPGFVIPPRNGCFPTFRSFTGGAAPRKNEEPTKEEYIAMLKASFFPSELLGWMEGLPYFHEDEHAIYVHAGLPKQGDGWLHPAQLADPRPLLWLRDADFFRNYRGKRVVFGHTATITLPQELSNFTPEDPTDLFAGENVIGIDTRCGHGGFLTAIELPSLQVYESREPGASPAVLELDDSTPA
jgi:serine/threonine protein phosphatase 1